MKGEEHSGAPLPFRKAPLFVCGAPDPKFFPETALPEIAVIGRSNVGKSSLINALLGRSDVARTSKTPGRTREINFFEVGGTPPVFHLVDLPGYGFAKISQSENKHWRFLCEGYLAHRRQLARALLLIDARHDMMESDRQMLDALIQWRVPTSIVLTKTDGSKKVQLDAHIQDFEALHIKAETVMTPLFKTSAAKRLGLRALQDEILKAVS